MFPRFNGSCFLPDSRFDSTVSGLLFPFVSRLVVLFSFALLLFGKLTLSATDSAEPVRKSIVILGDSLAAGYGVDPSEAFPALLQKRVEASDLPFTVVNAGVSGDTTAGG